MRQLVGLGFVVAVAGVSCGEGGGQRPDAAPAARDVAADEHDAAGGSAVDAAPEMAADANDAPIGADVSGRFDGAAPEVGLPVEVGGQQDRPADERGAPLGACTPVAPGTVDPCGAGYVCPPAAGSGATCARATAPVIDGVELFPAAAEGGDDRVLYLSAHDGQGDWQNLHLASKDEQGALLSELDVDMTVAWGQTVLAELALPLTLPAGMVTLTATLTDGAGLASAMRDATLLTWSTTGQSCTTAASAPDTCLDELICIAGTCAASRPAVAACAQPTAVAFDQPVRGTASELGTDAFESGCYFARRGNERVYRVELPALAGGALAWDLIVTTVDASSPWDFHTQLDTYVYVRSTCLDPTTELGCNDDVTDDDLRSQVVAADLAPGSYYVFLDTSSPVQNGGATAFTFVVHKRAVLPTGAACDATAAASRCRAGACSATTGLCP